MLSGKEISFHLTVDSRSIIDILLAMSKNTNEMIQVRFEDSLASASSSACSSGRISPDSATGDLTPPSPDMASFNPILPSDSLRRRRTTSASKTDDVIRRKNKVY